MLSKKQYLYGEEAMNQCTRQIQKLSEGVKSDKSKVKRAITRWGAIEKSQILLLQYCKIKCLP